MVTYPVLPAATCLPSLLRSEVSMLQKIISLADARLKFASDKASFEGYASVFNGVDAYGDTILPGAFKNAVRAARKGRMPKSWQRTILACTPGASSRPAIHRLRWSARRCFTERSMVCRSGFGCRRTITNSSTTKRGA